MRVVSFSLWGDRIDLLTGALENINLVKDYYPGWTPRIYVDDSVSQETLFIINTTGCELMRVKNPYGDKYGMFWRFFAGDDPDVEYFISRDLDSRISLREAEAVKEWIDSGKTMHIMRDHPHHNFPIQGGMCGFKTGKIKWRELIDRYMHHTGNATYGCDQFFLAQVVYPKLINDQMAHDEYYSNRFPHCRPYPSHEPMTFGSHVGERVPPFKDGKYNKVLTKLSLQIKQAGIKNVTKICIVEKNRLLMHDAINEFWKPAREWLSDMSLQIFDDEANKNSYPIVFSVFGE